MTEHEFVIWLRGFMEACNDYTATPKQWDRIKEELEKLDQVSNKQDSITVGNGGNGTMVFTSTPRWDLTNTPQGPNITYTTKQQLND